MPKEIDGVTYYTKDEVFMDQSEVDRVIQDRLARVEKKPDDYDTVKARVQELEQEKTRLESTVQEKDQELTQAVEAARQEVRDELSPEVAKAQIKAAAVQKGFRNADDAITFYGDLPTELDGTAIEARLAEIATERSYLISSDPTPSASDVGVGVSGAGTAPSQPGLQRVESALEPK